MPTATQNRPAAKPKAPPQIIKTWLFDSVGNRKYAMQIKKAGNGNPFLTLVEGVPQPDGTYRKFNITLWSEDFQRFFSTLDEVRAFMSQNNIKTPDGHKYDPHARPRSGGKFPRRKAAAAPLVPAARA